MKLKFVHSPQTDVSTFLQKHQFLNLQKNCTCLVLSLLMFGALTIRITEIWVMKTYMHIPPVTKFHRKIADIVNRTQTKCFVN